MRIENRNRNTPPEPAREPDPPVPEPLIPRSAFAPPRATRLPPAVKWLLVLAAAAVGLLGALAASSATTQHNPGAVHAPVVIRPVNLTATIVDARAVTSAAAARAGRLEAASRRYRSARKRITQRRARRAAEHRRRRTPPPAARPSVRAAPTPAPRAPDRPAPPPPPPAASCGPFDIC